MHEPTAGASADAEDDLAFNRTCPRASIEAGPLEFEYTDRCLLAGQAREVVGIWRAAVAAPRHEAQLRRVVATNPLFKAEVQDGAVTSYWGSEQWELTKHTAVTACGSSSECPGG